MVLPIATFTIVAIGGFVASVSGSPTSAEYSDVLSETQSITPESAAEKSEDNQTAEKSESQDPETGEASVGPTQESQAASESITIETEELEVGTSGWGDEELGSEFEL